MVTGYIVGLSCLFLITYRTLIAFFSESKAVIIHINKFGEQYIDLFALVVIWIICLVGLIALFWMLKEEKVSKNSFNKPDKRPTVEQDYSNFDIVNNIDQKLKLDE